VWGSQPDIGIMGDYYTNPALVNLPDSAESHADLLLDAPTSYIGDGYKLTLLPSFRWTNAQGYSYLDSPYDHLSVINEFDTGRSVTTLTTTASRDSSLYHDYLLDGSTGVRRDSELADLTWDHHFSERLELNVDGNWTRVLYGEASGTATLTDYKYYSLAPMLSRSTSERGTLTLQATGGRYNSINGRTDSTSVALQAGFTEQLSELWSVTASAGDSRAKNRADVTEIFYLFGIIPVPVSETLRATQNGSIYSITLSRQTERVNLTVVASRQLAPTGFAFLSHEDVYQIKATFLPTLRWSLSGDVHRVTYQQPAENLTGINIDLDYLDLSAAWRWTEHWTLNLSATKVMERYESSRLNLASTGASIEMSRQFDWKSLQ